MKKYLITLIIAACFFNIPAMGQDAYKQLYEKKVKSYSKMRSTGGTLAIIGAVFTAAGTALLCTVPDYTYDDYSITPTNEDEVALQVLGGVVGLGVGIDMLTAGIIVGSIGSHKYKQYKSKLDNLSMHIICSPKQQGFMLTYRF